MKTEKHLDNGNGVEKTNRGAKSAMAILDKTGESFESESNQKFRAWLDTVEDENNGNVELKMGVVLSPIHWMQLAAIAHANEWTIECAIMMVLEHGLEDWGPSRERAAEFRDGRAAAKGGAQ